MVNYQNGLIYKIVCNDLRVKETYYGSTTNFNQRVKQHKLSCYNSNNSNYNQSKYKFIRDNGGWDNWKMVLIKYFPCDNKRELERAERYEMENDNNRLNTILSYKTNDEKKETNKITWKKRYNDNKDSFLQYQTLYRKDNKEKIQNYKKEFYENNKDKIKEYQQNNKEQIKERRNKQIICECGSVVSHSYLTRHKRTQKHLKLIE